MYTRLIFKTIEGLCSCQMYLVYQQMKIYRTVKNVSIHLFQSGQWNVLFVKQMKIYKTVNKESVFCQKYSAVSS